MLGICISIGGIAFLVLMLSLAPEIKQILMPDPFARLTYEDRVAVLKWGFEKECRRLQLKIPLRLDIKELPPMVAGRFSPVSGTITISKAMLMCRRVDGAEILATVAHECYHAMCFERIFLANAAMLSQMTEAERLETERLRNGFLHYKKSADGWNAYKMQYLEVEARRYEENRRRFFRKHMGQIVGSCLKRKKK